MIAAAGARSPRGHPVHPGRQGTGRGRAERAARRIPRSRCRGCWPGRRRRRTPTGGLVVVLAAGTSDLPVAREAELTARYLGRPTELVVDVGVAGLHRVLRRLDLLRSARVVVVAAGMDGALPSVVAGLISAPVVAVPTSVGYGAAFEGLAALLAMLNACAPGRRRGQHRQRLRRGPPGRPDRRRRERPGCTPGSTPPPGSPATCCSAPWSTPAPTSMPSRHAVDAVIPDSVRITATPVTRAGQRATKIDDRAARRRPAASHWRDIAGLLQAADLAEPVRGRALRDLRPAGRGRGPGARHPARGGALPRGRRAGLDRRRRRGLLRPCTRSGSTRLSCSPVAVGSGRITHGPRRPAGPGAGRGGARHGLATAGRRCRGADHADRHGAWSPRCARRARTCRPCPAGQRRRGGDQGLPRPAQPHPGADRTARPRPETTGVSPRSCWRPTSTTSTRGCGRRC